MITVFVSSLQIVRKLLQSKVHGMRRPGMRRSPVKRIVLSSAPRVRFIFTIRKVRSWKFQGNRKLDESTTTGLEKNATRSATAMRFLILRRRSGQGGNPQLAAKMVRPPWRSLKGLTALRRQAESLN